MLVMWKMNDAYFIVNDFSLFPIYIRWNLQNKDNIYNEVESIKVIKVIKVM